MSEEQDSRFLVASEIDPEATFSAEELERLVNKVTLKLGLHARALAAKDTGYLEEIYELFQGTHISIRMLLGSRRHHTALPVGDALSLARDQIEAAILATFLMSDFDKGSRLLLRCSMLKLALQVGLEQGQHQNLERWSEVRESMLRGLRLMAPEMNCTWKEVRDAFNAGFHGEIYYPVPQIKPSKLMTEVADDHVRRGLLRLYQEYRQLSNFTHLHFDKLVAHHKQADIVVGDLGAFEFFKRHESQAVVCSMAAIAVTGAAHLRLLGCDLELKLAVTELWEMLCRVSMLGIALWDALGSHCGMPSVLTL